MSVFGSYRVPDVPFAWYALRDAYRASKHEPTLLRLSNLDAHCRAIWDETVYTADEITVNLGRAWYGVRS